jgi:RimJ/RimL family protein N-acetyltransferase
LQQIDKELRKLMNDTNVFDFSAFPVLATERLTLRKLLLSDASDVLVFRGDWEVQKYNGPVFQDVEEAQTLIEELYAEYAAQVGIGWAVTLTNRDTVLGLFGFHHWNKYHRRAEVGYDLARAYWGQGIASETLRAIIRFGFDRMNLNRIYAGTIADNHESVRLLEKLGFQREGTRRKHSWEEDGTFHDSAMYGLLRDEYPM